MSDNSSLNNAVTEKELPSPQGMTVKVVKGSFWVLIGQLLPLIATFIASPFVIRSLGSESYGVLILVGLISGYFSFVDFGMGLTSTKFGSEAYAEGSADKEALIIRAATIIAITSYRGSKIDYSQHREATVRQKIITSHKDFYLR